MDTSVAETCSRHTMYIRHSLTFTCIWWFHRHIEKYSNTEDTTSLQWFILHSKGSRRGIRPLSVLKQKLLEAVIATSLKLNGCLDIMKSIRGSEWNLAHYRREITTGRTITSYCTNWRQYSRNEEGVWSWLVLVYKYRTVHDFWTVEFSNGGLGASH